MLENNNGLVIPGHGKMSERPLNILIIGGTGFIGRHITRLLNERGHRVALFHRRPSDLFSSADFTHFYGNRESLDDLKQAFDAVEPDLVVDTCALFERHIVTLSQATQGVHPRLIVLSSIDVYKAYEVTAKLSDAPIQPLPLMEISPLRDVLFPYRGKLDVDFAHDYEKILVEQAAFSSMNFQTTVVRLGMVYGEHDPNRRFRDTVQQMKDNATTISLPKPLADWQGSKIYVENVAHGIVMLAEAHPLTEKQWTEAVAQYMSWRGEIRLEDNDSVAMNTLSINPLQDFIANSTKIRLRGYRELSVAACFTL